MTNPNAEWLRKFAGYIADAISPLERQRLEHCADLIEGSSSEPDWRQNEFAPRGSPERDRLLAPDGEPSTGMSVEPKYITKYCMDHGHWYHWPDTPNPACPKCPALKSEGGQ